ncbi:MAG: hypothetical protein ACW981_05385 [Candidatus Hodarchaeales archaeon]|jgi:hypothetical protein
MGSYPVLEKILNSLGESITISGQISEVIWQHMISYQPEYPHSDYFDLEDEYQIVIYCKEKIEIKTTIEITGKVIKVSGQPKRPTKVNEEYSEYQMLVDNWKPIDSKN